MTPLQYQKNDSTLALPSGMHCTVTRSVTRARQWEAYLSIFHALTNKARKKYSVPAVSTKINRNTPIGYSRSSNTFGGTDMKTVDVKYPIQ